MKKEKILGYNERHLAQLIRRKMLTKVKPSGKVYNRKKHPNKKDAFLLLENPNKFFTFTI